MPNQPLYIVPGPYGLRYPFNCPGGDFQTANEFFTAVSPILPSRFVSIYGSNSVCQSMGGDWPIGICQPNTAVWNSQYAATPGFPVEVFGLGRDCYLRLGGSVSAGDWLKSDSLGRGIRCCGRQYYAAKAYEDGEADQLVRVKVLRGLVETCGYSEYSYEYSYEFGLPCDCG